ncbi:uncharacterized protein LOC134284731, partial [Aedes albopictus]|uniref:Uncharacterized protein n=1 Tax=Aedes albopictus TaxID=7160 RepID=A0ABM2A0V0_AEDAL
MQSTQSRQLATIHVTTYFRPGPIFCPPFIPPPPPPLGAAVTAVTSLPSVVSQPPPPQPQPTHFGSQPSLPCPQPYLNHHQFATPLYPPSSQSTPPSTPCCNAAQQLCYCGHCTSLPPTLILSRFTEINLGPTAQQQLQQQQPPFGSLSGSDPTLNIPTGKEIMVRLLTQDTLIPPPPPSQHLHHHPAAQQFSQPPPPPPPLIYDGCFYGYGYGQQQPPPVIFGPAHLQEPTISSTAAISSITSSVPDPSVPTALPSNSVGAAGADYCSHYFAVAVAASTATSSATTTTTTSTTTNSTSCSYK